MLIAMAQSTTPKLSKYRAWAKIIKSCAAMIGFRNCANRPFVTRYRGASTASGVPRPLRMKASRQTIQAISPISAIAPVNQVLIGMGIGIPTGSKWQAPQGNATINMTKKRTALSNDFAQRAAVLRDVLGRIVFCKKFRTMIIRRQHATSILILLNNTLNNFFG